MATTKVDLEYVKQHWTGVWEEYPLLKHYVERRKISWNHILVTEHRASMFHITSGITLENGEWKAHTGSSWFQHHLRGTFLHGMIFQSFYPNHPFTKNDPTPWIPLYPLAKKLINLDCSSYQYMTMENDETGVYDITCERCGFTGRWRSNQLPESIAPCIDDPKLFVAQFQLPCCGYTPDGELFP